MKRSINALAPILIFLFAISCGQKSTESGSRLALDWDALSNKIIERSNLQSGQRVIMLAQPGDFDPLIELLARKIPKTGAVYLGTLSVDSTSWPESWKTDYIKSAMADTEEGQWKVVDGVDLGIMLPGATPDNFYYKTLQATVSQGVGRTLHFHWSGLNDFSSSPLPIDKNTDALYQKAVLETDYKKLSAIQNEFETALRKDWVTVTTPKGTNIKFQIGDRPVTKQNGDASLPLGLPACLIEREIELPAGAVRVAPLEATVEGVIAFPDQEWNGQKVEGLVLTFNKGTVTEINAKVGKDAVMDEISNGDLAAQSFREFVLGFNPLLAIPEGTNQIPYYGYGAGVVRLSLGNNQELGGEVYQGDYVRIGLFTDATVTIGTEVWVKDGKLLKGY